MTDSRQGQLYRATIFHTPGNPFLEERALQVFEDGALLLCDGRVKACGEYRDLALLDPAARVHDLRGGYLLPGFVDTHIHFPQVRVLGCLGRSLLDWLAVNTLPEEARFFGEQYGRAVAKEFVRALACHGTTTALVFGAHFVGATAALFEEGERAGLRIVSGLVVSDRMLRDDLHTSPEAAYRNSKELIERFHGVGRSHYAVTPRFALSASEQLLEVCQTLLREHPGVGFQSHINESEREVAEVARLFPWARDYFDVYERFELTGERAVLAHNVRPRGDELLRMAAQGTSVAHCPCSNAALGSGFFPMRQHVSAGVKFGLGSDVGGGTGFGMLKEGLQAYLLQRLAPEGYDLTAAHLLYLCTRAGAAALGLGHEVGDFSAGKSGDFVYIRPQKDTVLSAVTERAETPERVLSALFTLGDAQSVRQVRVAGELVHEI